MATPALRHESSPLIHRRSLLAAAAAALLAPAAHAQGAADGPMQHYIMIDVQPSADLLAVDRWYITHHAPETRARTQGAQTRYVSYRTYAVTDAEAARFNMARGRMTEIAFDSVAAFRAGITPQARARVAITPPPAQAAFTTDTVTMRTTPTRRWKDEPTPSHEAPYVRWIMFLRPPESVAEAAFDAWIEDTLGPALATAAQTRRVLLFRRIEAVPSQTFTHTLEVWFESMDDWRVAAAAFEANTPAPAWGGVFPYADMRSCLIGERPDLDFRIDTRVSP